MAKITRKTAAVFASNAGGAGISEPGAIAAGSAVYSTDLDVLQSADYLTGWAAMVLAGTKRLPPYEDMNAVQYILSTQIAYGLQEGIPEYDAGTEYHANSIVKKPATYELYGSIVNTNTGNALPAAVDDANWKYLGDLSDLISAGAIVVNNKTDNYTMLVTDFNTIVEFEAAVAKTFTLYNATSAEDEKFVIVRNIGTADLTISPDGADTTEVVTVVPGGCVMLQWMNGDTTWRKLYSNGAFGEWSTTKTKNTDYLAASDGYVCAVASTTSATSDLRVQFKTDVGATPSVVRVANSGDMTYPFYAGGMIPVKKGHSYSVTIANESTYAIYFMQKQ